MEAIAHIHSDFPTKFGVPRQSGLVPELKGRIVFTPPYRDPNALRGLEGFDYIWVIWQFHGSTSQQVNKSIGGLTVRPPRLGGNERMGVFATRSSFRPNGLALSSLKVEQIEWNTPCGPVIHVSGIDMMDGTPVLDIKPYVTFTDSHPDARSGFVDTRPRDTLHVEFPPRFLALLPADKQSAALALLAQDPRPAYQSDPTRTYGLPFAGFDIRFRVTADDTATHTGGTLIVTDVVPL